METGKGIQARWGVVEFDPWEPQEQWRRPEPSAGDIDSQAVGQGVNDALSVSPDVKVFPPSYR